MPWKQIVNAIDAKQSIVYIYNMNTSLNDGFMPSIIIRDIDLDLRKRFRRICLDEDISMNQLLKDMILKYVEGSEKRQSEAR